jgi:hypothetical protein
VGGKKNIKGPDSEDVYSGSRQKWKVWSQAGSRADLRKHVYAGCQRNVKGSV